MSAIWWRSPRPWLCGPTSCESARAEFCLRGCRRRMAILAPGEHRWCESRKEHPEPEGKRPDWIAHLVPMRPQRLQRMARIAGNDGGQGFLDLGAPPPARAPRERTRVVWGSSVGVRSEFGGFGILKNN